MGEFKGTPGPWHLSIPKHTGRWAGFNTDGGTCFGIYATNEDLEAIAMVPKDKLLINGTQDNEANARLIAAAPELLEALQELLGWYVCFTPREIEAKTKAESAINKALGKEAKDVQ